MGEDSSSRLKTHDQLMTALSAVDKTGNCWFLPKDGKPELIFAAANVNAELRALLTSAHMLYRISATMRDAFEPLIILLEDNGLDAAVPALLTHQAAIETAMRCATQGIEKVLPPR